MALEKCCYPGCTESAETEPEDAPLHPYCIHHFNVVFEERKNEDDDHDYEAEDDDETCEYCDAEAVTGRDCMAMCQYHADLHDRQITG